MNISISDIDYKQIVEYALEPIVIHTDLKIVYVNRAAEVFFRANRENIVGVSPLEIFKDSSKTMIEKRIQSAYENPAEVIEETVYRMDSTIVDVELYCHPAQIGEIKAVQSYITDITERKNAEKEHNLVKMEINELAATLVPLLDGIAVLPLVGSIDEDRARQLVDIVPLKVQKQKVEYLIIDFSGIYQLNEIVTDYLFKLNNVVSMLGVRSIITGLRPELAVTAIKLNRNVSSSLILATVKDALYSLGVNLKN